MELTEEQLNVCYQHSDGLWEFINRCDCSDNWRRSDQNVIDLVDWWKNKKAYQKYTVQVTPGNYGYLNILSDWTNGDKKFHEQIWFGGLLNYLVWKNRFTKQEIEQLKQRDDLAIDWDKAIIEPVEENND